ARPPAHLTPATRDPAIARDWFERFEGAGFDGIIARQLDAPYQPGKRVLAKIKHLRTADCVVGGFRWNRGEEGRSVGSLLLGLYDEEGILHFVGHTSSFGTSERRELVAFLAPYRTDDETVGFG
ncbi:MAG: ATP-dependent DNA ligase, partial [Chloroflexota bacterium]